MAEFESCMNCKHVTKKETDFPCNECKHGVNVKDHYKPRSNADRIRSMSDEELAEFLTDHHRYPCKYCGSCWADSESDEMGCGKGLIQWLKSEVKE